MMTLSSWVSTVYYCRVLALQSYNENLFNYVDLIKKFFNLVVGFQP